VSAVAVFVDFTPRWRPRAGLGTGSPAPEGPLVEAVEDKNELIAAGQAVAIIPGGLATRADDRSRLVAALRKSAGCVTTPITQATLARWCRIRSYLDSAAAHDLTALEAVTADTDPVSKRRGYQRTSLEAGTIFPLPDPSRYAQAL
jgi:hypothetical protein